MQPNSPSAAAETIAARAVIASIPAGLAFETSCHCLADGQSELSRSSERLIGADLQAWNEHIARVMAAPEALVAVASFHHFLWDCWKRHGVRWVEAGETIRETSLRSCTLQVDENHFH